MNRSVAIGSTPPLWSEEPSSRPDRARIRARIGGLHCSLCTGTIERALGKLPGVDNVSVSLTHEQARKMKKEMKNRFEALSKTGIQGTYDVNKLLDSSGTMV